MKTKDPRRQLRGQMSKAMGKNFETYIDHTFESYKHKGVAVIEKTPEPIRVVRPLGGGKFVAFFEKSAQVDYKGTLAGGRSVIAEAKFTSTDKMQQDRVSDGQADYLTSHHRLGAVCFIIIGFGSGAVYRIPWTVWKNMKKIYGRKYLMENDIKEYVVPVGRNGMLKLLDDWKEESQ